MASRLNCDFTQPDLPDWYLLQHQIISLQQVHFLSKGVNVFIENRHLSLAALEFLKKTASLYVSDVFLYRKDVQAAIQIQVLSFLEKGGQN